jgi:hypothetical protein
MALGGPGIAQHGNLLLRKESHSRFIVGYSDVAV